MVVGTALKIRVITASLKRGGPAEASGIPGGTWVHFESMAPGDGLFHRFRALALVLPGAGQIGVEVAFDLVVQLDADDFAATAFDFIADLVIEPIEFGIVERFFGLLETVVGDLVRTKESAVGESPMAFLGERHGANRGKVGIHDGSLLHKPLAAQVREIVVHAGGVAVVGELG